MQTISRKNLQSLYNNVCEGWQSRIKTELNNQMFSDTIEVKDSVISEAFAQSDADQKVMLKKYFTVPQDIMDKIKSIEDIYSILGIDRKLPYPKPNTKLERYLNACYDIPHITMAYNEGIILDWTNQRQSKFYIWWKNVSGSWVLVSVDDYCYAANLGFGSYFAKQQHAKDASVKFKNTFIDYLPE